MQVRGVGGDIGKLDVNQKLEKTSFGSGQEAQQRGAGRWTAPLPLAETAPNVVRPADFNGDIRAVLLRT